MKKFTKCFTFYLLLILSMEVIYKISAFNILFNTGLIFTILFTAIYALIFTFLTIFLPKKLSNIVLTLLMIFTTIIFIGEFMFYKIFDTTFSVYSLNMAGQALDFKKILFTSMQENYLILILFVIPFIIYMLFHKKVYFKIDKKYILNFMGIIIGFISLLISFILKLPNNTYSIHNLLAYNHAPTIMINKMGVLTEFNLDILRYLTNFSNRAEINVDSSVDNEDETEQPKETEYNKLDLNFEFESSNEVKNINNYFNLKNSTNKNEYTGIFEGKNLIYILAEGFNSIAVDENITPTLYKLVNSSFVFENYYSPVFMSTTGGEFQYSLGLIPTQNSLNTWKKGEVYLPYSIGNVFNNLGYTTNAYHDWTYTYYKRNKTMPTLGFSSYTGCGNGLEKLMNCKQWPTSDVEMIDATTDFYINEEQFVTYYITVSGHAEYNFSGNNMARKNKSAVSNLEYSDAIKAYLATQIELDKAIANLIDKLDFVGKLNDTVIVLSGDHYPYTLNTSQINEISTYKRDALFEVNHSNLIIYNPEIQTTKIDKLSSSVDVIPTLLNMFGINYDSRLLMGSDIMSDHDSLVVFSNYSWISDKGRYNSTTNSFTPNDGIMIDDNYVSIINKEVQNRVSVSTNILSTNYYNQLFDNQ